MGSVSKNERRTSSRTNASHGHRAREWKTRKVWWLQTWWGTEFCGLEDPSARGALRRLRRLQRYLHLMPVHSPSHIPRIAHRIAQSGLSRTKSAMRKQAVQRTLIFGLRTRTWAADLDKDEVIHTQLAELLFEGGLDVGREMRLPQHRGAPYSAATQHQLTPNARLPRSASDRFRTPRFLVVSEILQTSQICQCCPVWTAGHLPWLCGVPGSALDAMTLRPSPSVRDS